MKSFYQLGIYFFWIAALIASLFSKKASRWVKGRLGLFSRISGTLDSRDQKRVWFHASSLGEYELCKPLISSLKEKDPDLKVVVTFFSPSGFDSQPDTYLGDYFFYLPLDSKENANKLLGMIKPEAAFFAKYDLWYFYLRVCRERQIPTILFSASFRPDQFYFQSWGRFFLEEIKGITKIFVLDNRSQNLLEKHKVNSTLAGDSRFDRVLEITKEKVALPLIDGFTNHEQVIVVGSCWPSDLDKIVPGLVHSCKKVIFAPHDISQPSIENLTNRLGNDYVKFSELKRENAGTYRFLIIDNIGYLSRLYSYAEVAYVGGGFLEALHNILEPAAWGVPTIFGPNIKRNPEAVELMEMGGGFSIRSSQEFSLLLESLFNDPEVLWKARNGAFDFVNRSKGASEKIISNLSGILKFN